MTAELSITGKHIEFNTFLFDALQQAYITEAVAKQAAVLEKLPKAKQKNEQSSEHAQTILERRVAAAFQNLTVRGALVIWQAHFIITPDMVAAKIALNDVERNALKRIYARAQRGDEFGDLEADLEEVKKLYQNHQVELIRPNITPTEVTIITLAVGDQGVSGRVKSSTSVSFNRQGPKHRHSYNGNISPNSHL